MAEGKVFHSCGHSDMWRPVAGWPLYYKDYDMQWVSLKALEKAYG